jgi:hypothetical protein
LVSEPRLFDIGYKGVQALMFVMMDFGLSMGLVKSRLF